MSGVDLYSVGPVSASACALKALPIEDVTAEVNRLAHPGIGHGWQPADEPTFASGEPQPGPCNVDPHGRVHYLFHC